MLYFISENVSKEGRNLFFGDLPDEDFTIIKKDWTLADILSIMGAETDEKDFRPIPIGFSQFQAEDFEKSVFILNL
jgi:hypothetical protein